jgi:hypothetical protein
MQCSMGTTPASFSASGESVAAGTAAGVVDDIADENIPPFGMCNSLSNPQVAAASSGGTLVPQTCQPVIAGPWSPGSTGVTLDQVAALDDGSTCDCAWGGTISITSAGQTDCTIQ